MSEVKCPSCGSPNVEQIDVDKYQCPYCGATFTASAQSHVNKILTIHGYTQWFAVCPNVEIWYNGQKIGAVAKDGIFQINISAPCQLVFKCSLRSTTLSIDPSVDTDVYLSFDRITGSIKADKQQAGNVGVVANGNAVQMSDPTPLNVQPQANAQPKKTKNRVLAAVLAICFGGLGVHHFYLGNYIRGIVYLVFCWTYIPSIVALIEGIIYLTQSDEVFASKHSM